MCIKVLNELAASIFQSSRRPLRCKHSSGTSSAISHIREDGHLFARVREKSNSETEVTYCIKFGASIYHVVLFSG